MAEDSLVHKKAIFKRNAPITTGENVPLSELGHSSCRRREYIRKRKIEELAIEKYKTTGKGIAFTDVTREFTCSKKAQRIRADIIEDLRKRENVLKHPTEVSYSSRPKDCCYFSLVGPVQFEADMTDMRRCVNQI
jgi:hypothetical protein